jgi:16S rRNA (uracil1498-N3)-methyltransferase
MYRKKEKGFVRPLLSHANVNDMRVHRFYVPGRLSDELLIEHRPLVHQMKRVLRIRAGDTVRLFNGAGVERVYLLASIDDTRVDLRFQEDIAPNIPKRHITLFFSLLKKDKTEWVMQKTTEIGVSRLVPLFTDRTEKTGFSRERAERIVIEAAEQCGRGDIPEIVEPLQLEDAIDEFDSLMELFYCDEGESAAVGSSTHALGCFVGPEGGWSDAELEYFARRGIQGLALSPFTLRAETACVAAVLTFSTAHSFRELDN